MGVIVGVLVYIITTGRLPEIIRVFSSKDNEIQMSEQEILTTQSVKQAEATIYITSAPIPEPTKAFTPDTVELLSLNAYYMGTIITLIFMEQNIMTKGN